MLKKKIVKCKANYSNYFIILQDFITIVSADQSYEANKRNIIRFN